MSDTPHDKPASTPPVDEDATERPEAETRSPDDTLVGPGNVDDATADPVPTAPSTADETSSYESTTPGPVTDDIIPERPVSPPQDAGPVAEGPGAPIDGGDARPDSAGAVAEGSGAAQEATPAAPWTPDAATEPDGADAETVPVVPDSPGAAVGTDWPGTESAPAAPETAMPGGENVPTPTQASVATPREPVAAPDPAWPGAQGAPAAPEPEGAPSAIPEAAPGTTWPGAEAEAAAGTPAAPKAPVASDTPSPVVAGAPAAPEAPPRPVFDPAPPPPRNDVPAAPPEGAAPDVTTEVPPTTPEPAAGGPSETDAVLLDEEAGDGSPKKSSLARKWPLVLLPLIVVAVVVAAFAVKKNTDEAVDRVNTAPAFTTFRDPDMGFSIKYPSKWERAQRPDPEVRLLVKDEGLDSLLVRVARTPAPFPADLTGEEAKQVADVVLRRETFAPERILREQAVNVNGAPGYYYLYTFEEEVKTDSGTQKVQGVHAHYMVFSGRRVFALVFQALPTANFDRLAKTFDAMAESFRIAPLATDAPDPTTAPDPTATTAAPTPSATEPPTTPAPATPAPAPPG